MEAIVVLPKRNDENNSEYAFRVLNYNIMMLHLEPDVALNENLIAEKLSVSRTPVREAIIRLKDLKLVSVYPQRASIVTKISLELMKEGLFLRSHVEPIVFSIALRNLDPELAQELAENLAQQKEMLEGDRSVYDFIQIDRAFHEIIYRAAKKQHIYAAYSYVIGHFERIRFLDATEYSINLEQFYQEHKKIYYDLLAGIDSMEELYPAHLTTYQKGLPHMLEKYPQYFEV